MAHGTRLGTVQQFHEQLTLLVESRFELDFASGQNGLGRVLNCLLTSTCLVRGSKHMFEFGGIMGRYRQIPDAAFFSLRLGEGDGILENIAIRNLVAEADFNGLCGRDGFSIERHAKCFRDAAQARRTLGPAGTGEYAELDLRKTDPPLAVDQPIITAKGRFEPAAKRSAVHGRYHGDRTRLQRLDHVGKGRGFRWFAEFGDIGAGKKCPTVAMQHNCRGVADFYECLFDAVANGMPKSVNRRVVDPHDEDIAASFGGHDVIHVTAALCLNRSWFQLSVAMMSDRISTARWTSP